MAITDWPLSERPREKLLTQGPHTLTDAELLAIFIRSGRKGSTAVDVARELLQRCQGLRNLLDIPTHECSNLGLSSIQYVQLQAALEMGRRYLSTTLQYADAISHPEQVRNYLIANLRHHRQEIFACLFLNTKHYLIQFEKLFYGTIDAANVYPREVVKKALAYNAAAVIFAHNHPSGNAEPSQADKLITQQLIKALNLVDIRVLDHFIIGDGQIFSFAEHGLL